MTDGRILRDALTPIPTRSLTVCCNERVATLCYGTVDFALVFAPSHIGGCMNAVKVPMLRDKKIALVAHDNKKRDLLEWASFNRDLMAHHEVYATCAPHLLDYANAGAS
jgi:hypothetical protein